MTAQLLRWRAIQLAIREGCTEMDLGGVDIAPYHREPVDGEPGPRVALVAARLGRTRLIDNLEFAA